MFRQLFLTNDFLLDKKTAFRPYLNPIMMILYLPTVKKILKFLLSPSLEAIWVPPHTVTLVATPTVTKIPKQILGSSLSRLA